MIITFSKIPLELQTQAFPTHEEPTWPPFKQCIYIPNPLQLLLQFFSSFPPLPTKMAADKVVETVIAGNYVEMEADGNPPTVKSKLSNLFWHGGSVYDAWFSCASNQVHFPPFFTFLCFSVSPH